MGVKTDHHVKITELIGLLEEVKATFGDADVIMSKDGEGNDFSPFSGYSVGYYDPTSTWSGEFTSLDSIAEEPEEYEGDDFDGEQTVVCFWPVN